MLQILFVITFLFSFQALGNDPRNHVKHALCEKALSLLEQVESLSIEKKVTAEVSDEDLLSSRSKFQGFFEILNEQNVERAAVIGALQFILLIDGKMLLQGAAGTAKTELANTLFKNIIEAHDLSSGVKSPHFSSISITQQTKAEELPTQDKKYILFDNFQKAPVDLLPALSSFLNKGTPQAVLATASAEYDSQPFLSHFDIVMSIPGQLEEIKNVFSLSRERLVKPYLYEEDIQRLKSLLPKVVIPKKVILALTWFFHQLKQETEKRQLNSSYKSTHTYSIGTLKKVLRKYLPAVVLLRWIENPKTSLTAEIEDLAGLLPFFTKAAIVEESAEYFKMHSQDDSEKARHEHMIWEMKTFKGLMSQIISEEKQKKLLEGHLTDVSGNTIIEKLTFLENLLKNHTLPLRIMDLSVDQVNAHQLSDENIEYIRAFLKKSLDQ